MGASSLATRAQAPSSTRRLPDGFFIACGLSGAAGLIHVEATIGRSQGYELLAVLSALLAAVQLGWAVALYRRGDRRLLGLGALASLTVVAVWVLSCTTGLPIGPHVWRAQAVEPLELIATADEIALALVALLHLGLSGRRGLARGARKLAAGAGLVLILFSCLVLQQESGGKTQGGLRGWINDHFVCLLH